MFNRKLVAGVLSTFIACSAAAEESKLSYDSVSLVHSQVDVDGSDFDGFAFSGSKSVSESVFLKAGYTSLELEDNIPGIDKMEVGQLAFGVGYYRPVSVAMDLVGMVSYVKSDTKVRFDPRLGQIAFNDDDSIFILDLGLRSMVTNNIELGAFVQIDDESDTGVSLESRFYATDNLAFGLAYAVADDVDVIGVEASFHF